VETASKTIPILLQTVDLTMYPEALKIEATALAVLARSLPTKCSAVSWCSTGVR